MQQFYNIYNIIKSLLKLFGIDFFLAQLHGNQGKPKIG